MLAPVCHDAPLAVTEDPSRREWDEFVTTHPDATCDHLWSWRGIFEDVFGQRAVYFVARRGSAIVGALPVVCFRSRLFGRSVVSLPFLNYGGILASDSSVAQHLLAAVHRLACDFAATHVELRHSRRQFGHLPSRQHKLGFVRDLPQSPEALWASLDRKVRNQVRKAQKEGLTVRVGGVESVDEFYSVFARNMRDLGTPVYAKRLFVQVLQRMPERTSVAIVSHGGVPAAAAITIRFRDTVLVPWASSRREFRHLCPNMLLYWTMLEHAVAAGARRFDFGRSSPDSGPHQFKLQWGAEQAPLTWEYLLLTRETAPDQGASNPKFARAVDAWSRLPLWVTNRIGPAIVRNIP